MLQFILSATKENEMKYENVILELMSRIQNLEESIKKLDQRLAFYETGDEVIKDNNYGCINKSKYTRTDARNRAIEIIQNLFPDFKVEKAKRSDGSGIKIVNMETNDIRLIKLYHSKSVLNRSGGYEYGYHFVRLEELSKINPKFCLFSIIDIQGRWHFLIFNTADVFDYYEKKKYENYELQLYFSIQGDRAFELRGEEDENVTEHLENWKILC